MTLTLPDEDWLTILLALRRGAIGKPVRHSSDRDACSVVARRVSACIESAAGLRDLVSRLPPEATVVPSPEPEDDFEPSSPAEAGAWQALYDLFAR